MIPKSGQPYRWMLLALGASTIATQIILLREFMSVFSGNELVIGLVLAAWMTLTGAGALLGRFSGRLKNPRRWASALLLTQALLPVAAVIVLRALRNVVFPVGVLIGVWETFATAGILLVPYCLPSGFLFALLAHLLTAGVQKNRIAAAYGWESAGSAVAGAGVSVVLIAAFKTIECLLLVSTLLGLVAVYSARAMGQRVLVWIAGIVAVVSVFLLVAVPLDNWSKAFLYPDQVLTENRDTPYGNLVVTRLAEQLNVFENGILHFSTNDVIQSEESVHFALLQRPDSGSVLLISGGLSGRISEILKYPVTHIDYVELDPGILDLVRKYTRELTDPRVAAIPRDARLFLRETSASYCAVLVNLPDPSTALLNRYFTDEFVAEVRTRMTEDAVLLTSLMEQAEYRGEEARTLSSMLVNTLRRHFAHVVIVPGARNYYLASDRPLRVDLAGMAAGRGIATVSVNEYYLSNEVLRERSDRLMGEVDCDAGINVDFAPAAYGRYIRYWLSSLGTNMWWPLATCTVLLLFAGLRVSPVSFGILTAGFAASSFEVILLIAFQVVFGYVYERAGLLIALFMAGLAAGSFLGVRAGASRRNFLFLLATISFIGLALPEVLVSVKTGIRSLAMVQIVFSAAMSVVGAVIGATFALACRLEQGNAASVASGLYGMDLVGAAVGTLLSASYLIPVIGLTTTSILTGGVVAVGAVLMLIRTRGES